ncbi:hypothetical protein ACT3T7_08770 [Halomonas sp. 111]
MQLGVETIERINLARAMVLRGFVNKIVELETGLTMKTLNKVRSSLKEEGAILPATPRGTRQAQSIIKKICHRQDFSIIMLAYRRYGYDEIFQRVNLNALTQAFDTYLEIKKEISPLTEIANINDCYTLAVDLRSAEAEFETCHSCEVSFFVSFSQETSYRCPFCINRESAERVLECQSIAS